MCDVSIVIPCYNQGSLLSYALNSILSQNFQNWECIIVNDGSTDKTDLVAREWVAHDERFIYISQNNIGLSGARNAGLKVAKGDFLQFLDADDALAPDKIELSLKQISVLSKKKKNHIILTNFKCFKERIEDATTPFCELKSQYFDSHNILYQWDREFSIPIHCGIFSRELLKDFSFPVQLEAKEDWIMWLYLYSKKVETQFIDMPLAFYRSHNDSMTQNTDLMNQNKLNALLYLENILSDEELISFYQFIIGIKYKQVAVLQKSINNIRDSKVFKFRQELSKLIFKMFKR